MSLSAAELGLLHVVKSAVDELFPKTSYIAETHAGGIAYIKIYRYAKDSSTLNVAISVDGDTIRLIRNGVARRFCAGDPDSLELIMDSIGEFMVK